MPSSTCFSSAEVPLGVKNRNAAQRTLRDSRICFSYLADVPLGVRNRNAAQRVERDLPRRPATGCFSYSANRPRGEISRMPVWPCFSYTGSACFRY